MHKVFMCNSDELGHGRQGKARAPSERMEAGCFAHEQIGHEQPCPAQSPNTVTED